MLLLNFVDNKIKNYLMLIADKVSKIFCIADDFCQEFEKESEKMSLKSDGKQHPSWASSNTRKRTGRWPLTAFLPRNSVTGGLEMV